MKNSYVAKIIMLLATLLACFALWTSVYAAEPADYVYTGGKIYTVNNAQPWAEAIAVKGSNIVYVGDNAGAKAFIGKKTQVKDMGGKFMMPGIIDTHAHSIFYMITSSGLNISELSHDKNKMLAEVKAYLEKNPDGPYYSFGGATAGNIISSWPGGWPASSI